MKLQEAPDSEVNSSGWVAKLGGDLPGLGGKARLQPPQARQPSSVASLGSVAKLGGNLPGLGGRILGLGSQARWQPPLARRYQVRWPGSVETFPSSVETSQARWRSPKFGKLLSTGKQAPIPSSVATSLSSVATSLSSVKRGSHLPKLGGNLPKLSSHLPRLGSNLPGLGKNHSRLGGNLVRLGEHSHQSTRGRRVKGDFQPPTP
ncbi:hypothetical protein RHMOL_Rhmol08G0182600 [Rhododendron molle]|uniref:Uncharacterized protein n=1 Tax=Rhododendron molle TaxID=49168 RepID=A0ACC0MRQ6_RHOML|nr:hypothetical protein RHMOL_Rhmol08G0182600 [Rhododendron molle]